jgi:hypothetical protein
MKKKRNSRKVTSNDLVQNNLGIIAGRALHYWQKLPASVKVYYDAEDMINDVVAHVVRVSSRYRASAGRSSTWCWRVSENYCKDLLYKRFLAKKQGAYLTIAFENDQSSYLPDPKSFLELQEARVGVERIFEFGSDQLKEILEGLFTGTACVHFLQDGVVQEFRRLAKAHHVHINDFRLVCRYLVG